VSHPCSRRARTRSGRSTLPISSSVYKRKRRLPGGFSPARRKRFGRQGQLQHRCFMVTDAAAVESSVALSEDERRRVTGLDRIGGLHIQGTVDEDCRDTGRVVPVSEDSGVTPRLSGFNREWTGPAQPLRHPLGQSDGHRQHGQDPCSPTEWQQIRRVRTSIALHCPQASREQCPRDRDLCAHSQERISLIDS
jgi:hypothetical protein